MGTLARPVFPMKDGQECPSYFVTPHPSLARWSHSWQREVYRSASSGNEYVEATSGSDASRRSG